ncbi:hypothetical protein V6N13_106067 [Hibiscus sabdariffa]|uniref:TF-B3 domain-containing protein n=1 Tax=Hibiscus sabdariffa TaxID=183260 RepID=A0ABR2EZK9_9ROSI
MPRPFFHKLILSTTLQEKKLRIPDNFVKKFRDELSVAAALTVPDGHVWRVGIKKADNKIRREFCFQSLQNLLGGGSKLNNCINWGSDVNLQTSKGVNNQAIRVKLHTSGAMPPEPKKRGRKRKVDPNLQESSAGNVDDDMRFRCYESASARKRTVTAEERERAINAAKAFEPANPFCRVVLRPSYLYRGCIMYLPSCFAEKHLSGVSGSIKLQLPDGRQWSVRCLYKGGKAKFSRGWYEFTLENNLGEGDVCVFELLRAREFVLKVTVFRVMESSGLMHRSH